ncbi:glycosyltransferase family 2 protein [Pseudomonas oryzihabitans]|uniref:Glycosyltransferase involved in cell wall biosynthesis n=1 Tax=Pseudomonas oryzihabitans TaxID=47885 RepID=A0AAJ2BKJ0_9PSED|nr:glycosyltransferase family 2 protein [Pseudomonas psychrotolerans]MDR6234272.1 glycosyltransferase involved in cell wall biosynthesis [Pseudomonas psychrotolerans]MDR6356611.1 glycosyltransferase involved in cell wall biosynthesis [Pseudomonas psychrotolerans]
MSQEDNIAILLCTYNGAKYLRPQLDSIVNQSHKNWTIHISDDGSTDGTKEIIFEYIQKLGNERVKFYSGPKGGFSKNFFSLIKNKKIKAAYYAFSDQDDIWEREKLKRAIKSSAFTNNKNPSLYCGRTTYIDNNLKTIGQSPLFKRRPSFKNALIQSIAGGNTMVMNNAFKEILELTNTNKKIVSHDWWCYLLVTALGGQIIYDPVPGLGYRQHAENLVGANSSISDRIIRFKKMLGGTFSDWNDANLSLLTDFISLMPDENIKTLNFFKHSRTSGFFERLINAKRSGIYRQTFFGNAGLIFAYAIKRV